MQSKTQCLSDIQKKSIIMQTERLPCEVESVCWWKTLAVVLLWYFTWSMTLCCLSMTVFKESDTAVCVVWDDVSTQSKLTQIFRLGMMLWRKNTVFIKQEPTRWSGVYNIFHLWAHLPQLIPVWHLCSTSTLPIPMFTLMSTQLPCTKQQTDQVSDQGYYR